MNTWLQPLLHALALPEYGLSSVFALAFASATLLPMGSEPAVFGLSSSIRSCSGRPSASPPSATRWAAW